MQPEVLVVGAGPVGLTMAAELARFGIRTRIIDKTARRTDKSKALVLWPRTLELLDRAGCGNSFVSAGYQVTAANIVASGRQIAHVRLDEIATPHPYALMLPQSETERLLAQHLNSLQVSVERQVELIQFSTVQNGVEATLRHADGNLESVTADWMIGCDGAHSAVRHGLGMSFEGNTLLSDWILADVHLHGMTTPANELSLYWHAKGVLAVFPITPGRYRVIADVGDAKTDERHPDPTLAEVQSIIDERGPGGVEASDPIWLASFRINERKVADYRSGRVFLAGDAAHIHSPAGGQGMNTGMQDAFNLAWKIALVQSRRVVAEPLLNSYSRERSAVGRQVLVNANRLTTIATLRSTVWQEVRNHVGSLVFGLSFVRDAMANALSELSIGYKDSPLTEHGGHGLTGPKPGERAPVETSIISMDNMPRFELFAQSESHTLALVKRFPKLLSPEIRPPFDPNGVWLIRPDGYVAMAVLKHELLRIESYLGRLCGQIH